MTAVNIIRSPGCVHLITDGLMKIPEEMLNRLPPGTEGEHPLVAKAFPIPHLNLAFVVRGLPPHIAMLALAIPALAHSYDEVKDLFVEGIRSVWTSTAPLWEQQHGKGSDMADIFVAGISETTGPDSYAVVTHNRYRDTRAWQRRDLGPISMAPLDQAVFDKVAASLTAGESIEDVARAMIGAQRMQDVTMADGRALAGEDTIGGFVQVTSVRRDEITTRIVERYPAPRIRIAS